MLYLFSQLTTSIISRYPKYFPDIFPNKSLRNCDINRMAIQKTALKITYKRSHVFYIYIYLSEIKVYKIIGSKAANIKRLRKSNQDRYHMPVITDKKHQELWALFKFSYAFYIRSTGSTKIKLVAIILNILQIKITTFH